MHRKWGKKSVCSIGNFVITELDDAFDTCIFVYTCIHMYTS